MLIHGNICAKVWGIIHIKTQKKIETIQKLWENNAAASA